MISVDWDKLTMQWFNSLDRTLYFLESVLSTHLRGWKVCMTSTSIPISFYWLRMIWYSCSMIFSNTRKYIPGHPKVVTNLNTRRWTNLELPLWRKYLCISSCNPNTCIYTCFIMELHDRSTKRIMNATWTIILALRLEIRTNRPPKRPENRTSMIFK